MVSQTDAARASAREVQQSKRALLLFDDNKIKMARKPGKKQKDDLVGCTREGKR